MVKRKTPAEREAAKILPVTLIHYFHGEKGLHEFAMVPTEGNVQERAEALALQGLTKVQFYDQYTKTEIHVPTPPTAPILTLQKPHRSASSPHRLGTEKTDGKKVPENPIPDGQSLKNLLD